MKAQKTTRAPSNFLFFDTETKSEIDGKDRSKSYTRLWFGFAYAVRYENGKKTREKWCRFTTVEEFWDFVKSRLDKGRPLYMFAHNLGFDLTITDFWRISESEQMATDYIVLEDPPTFLRMTWDGKNMMMIDTMNYWRESLASIGKSIGMDKLEMPSMDAGQKAWDEYGRRDVEVVAEAIFQLVNFLKEQDLGNFAISQASLAMSAFKRRFMNVPIYIHDNERALSLEKESYHGGLVHCFQLGKIKRQEVHWYDVNSLYPYCMLNSVPTNLLRYYRNISVEECNRQIQTKGMVARVRIMSDSDTFPKFQDNRLLEVRGTFNTVLCGEELCRAFRRKLVHSVYECAVYETGRIFTDYVNFFYDLRQRYPKAVDPVRNNFAKIMMNSLYGKFAQSSYDWRDLTPEVIRLIYQNEGKKCPDLYDNIDNIPDIQWAQSKWFPVGLGKGITVRSLGGRLQVRYVLGEHHESFPLIASFITAYAREHLRRLIGIAGVDNCYYCDTDSLFVNSKGRKQLEQSGWIDNTKLGSLKYEGSSKHAVFYGPKDYEFGDTIKTKGISSRAIKVGDNEYLQNQFEGLRSVLKRKAEPYIEIKWIVKRLEREFKKGTVGDNGRTEFFSLNEGDWQDEQQMTYG